MKGKCPLYILAEAIQQFICINFYHWANSCGMYADGFYIPIIEDKNCHIPSALIMFSCPQLRHALLKWQKNKGVHPKASKSMLKADRTDCSIYFNIKNDDGMISSC
jgi:hypothetical protein